MLNTFPELLTFGLIGPFILRVVIGFVILNLGYLKLTKEKVLWQESFEALGFKQKELLTRLFGIIEIVGGSTLILGLYTQVAALVFVVITFIELYIERKEEALLSRDVTFYLLMFAIALSLLFTGAGFFAFDIPL